MRSARRSKVFFHPYQSLFHDHHPLAGLSDFVVLSSAIYSIYYSKYSTPYLSEEWEEGGLVVVVVVVREQETLLLDAIEQQVYILLGRRYRHSYTA